MKKFLLLFAITAISYIGCSSDDDDDDDYTTTTDYVLTVTPESVTVGDDLTLKISGDGANELFWVSYVENVDDGSGTNKIPYFEDGEAVFSTENLPAGDYKFYSKCAKLYVKTESVYVTILEATE
ncbi:MAG: hypothetical protein R3Y44_00710 [Rikenellaceae bacterium]